MLFLFISLACAAVFAAVFAATFAIDHFASVWENADAASWHGRFAAWANNSRKLDIVKGLSGLASAVACLVVLAAIFHALTYLDVGERRFALYVSNGPAGASGGGTIRQFDATTGDLRRMPAFEYVDSHLIVKGKVSSIMPIGGGLMHVCVANGDVCGLADSSMKLAPGEIAYVRIGRPPSSQRRPPGWTITAQEATELAATSKFIIENR